MTTLYSTLCFRNQPGSKPGLQATGCIPGAVKLEMWQPGDAFVHEGSGDVLVHVEPGNNVPFGTKIQKIAALSVLNALSDKIAAQFPRVRQWWYCPPPLRDDFYAASIGDKKAAARVKEWSSSIRDLMLLGFPGPRIHGVVVDMYDFEYMRAVWEKRLEASIAPWVAAGVPVLPILRLRYQDTGKLYTADETRDRVRFAGAMCGGRCAIFDGIDKNGVYEEYSTWPLRSVVESIARGD